LTDFDKDDVLVQQVLPPVNLVPADVVFPE